VILICSYISSVHRRNLRGGGQEEANSPQYFFLFLFPWRNSPQWGCASSLSRLHDHTQLDTPHLAGIIWTSDQPHADTSTCQHTILTRDKHPRPRWDLNPQSQQANGRSPTPEMARPLGSAQNFFYVGIFSGY
jgi:hypothetical protein